MAGKAHLFGLFETRTPLPPLLAWAPPSPTHPGLIKQSVEGAAEGFLLGPPGPRSQAVRPHVENTQVRARALALNDPVFPLRCPQKQEGQQKGKGKMPLVFPPGAQLETCHFPGLQAADAFSSGGGLRRVQNGGFC